MKRPVNLHIGVKGDWTIRFPGTGHLITSNHPSHFLQLCHEHMEINKIPIVGGWQEQMFNLACEQNPNIRCEEVGEQQKHPRSEDIWRFIRTLWKAMEQGAVAVPVEEAERRARICAACPKMGRTSCSGGCGALAEALSALTVGRGALKSIAAVHKASCSVCGCEVSSLVNYPLDVLHKVDEELQFRTEEYHPSCWKYQSPKDNAGDEISDQP